MLLCPQPIAQNLNGAASGSAMRRKGPATSSFERCRRRDIDSLCGHGALFFTGENSAKREEYDCNGNPYKIGSVRTKGQPLFTERGQEYLVPPP